MQWPLERVQQKGSSGFTDVPAQTASTSFNRIYTGCIYCGDFKSDCAEIVVPSGLGGVFQAHLLEIVGDGCRVQVINTQHGFDAMAPFVVPFEKIERRTRKAVLA